MKNHTKLLCVLVAVIIAVSAFCSVPFSASGEVTDKGRTIAESGYSISTYDEYAPSEIKLGSTYRLLIRGDERTVCFTPERDMTARFEMSVSAHPDATYDSMEYRMYSGRLYDSNNAGSYGNAVNVLAKAAEYNDNGDKSWFCRKNSIYELTAGRTYYYDITSWSTYATVEISVNEVERFTAAAGEKITAPEGYSVYEYTPEKDMLVYWHAVGASGASVLYEDDRSFKRSKTFSAKCGQPVLLVVKALKEAEYSPGITVSYDNLDFAIEEIPIVDAELDVASTELEYNSPLKYKDYVKDIDIINPEGGHSLIATLPIKAFRFTAEKDGWIDAEIDSGIYAQEIKLYDSELRNIKNSSDIFGIYDQKVKAGETYYLLVISDEDHINIARDRSTKYTVTFKNKEIPKLIEGHNTIVREAGSGDKLYLFEVPRSGYWVLRCPNAVSYQDIVLVYASENYGTDFSLDYPMSCVYGTVYVTVKANHTSEDIVYDLEVAQQHYPEIGVNKAENVSLSGDGDSAMFEFTAEKPMMVKLNAEYTATNNGRVSGTTIYDNKHIGSSFFAIPGETYYIRYTVYGARDKYTDEIYDSDAEVTVTLNDISDSIDEIVPDIATNDEVYSDRPLVYSFTPTEDVIMRVDSAYDNCEVVVYQKDRTDSLRASGANYFCEANKTCYICLKNNGYEKEAGSVILTQKPVPTGDADGDGEVTLMDATQVQYHIISAKAGADEKALMYADVDKNGSLEIVDSTFIQRWVAEIPIPYDIG